MDKPFTCIAKLDKQEMSIHIIKLHTCIVAIIEIISAVSAASAASAVVLVVLKRKTQIREKGLLLNISKLISQENIRDGWWF